MWHTNKIYFIGILNLKRRNQKEYFYSFSIGGNSTLTHYHNITVEYIFSIHS